MLDAKNDEFGQPNDLNQPHQRITPSQQPPLQPPNEKQGCFKTIQTKFQYCTDILANYFECTRVFSTQKLDQLKRKADRDERESQNFDNTAKSQISYESQKYSEFQNKDEFKNYSKKDKHVYIQDYNQLPMHNYSSNQKLKFTKRYAEIYEKSYSERQSKFGYTFQEVQLERLRQYQKKEKNCWEQFKRLICCRGGNYLDQLEEVETDALSETHSRKPLRKKHNEPSLANSFNQQNNIFLFQEQNSPKQAPEQIVLTKHGRRVNKNLKVVGAQNSESQNKKPQNQANKSHHSQDENYQNLGIDAAVFVRRKQYQQKQQKQYSYRSNNNYNPIQYQQQMVSDEKAQQIISHNVNHHSNQKPMSSNRDSIINIDSMRSSDHKLINNGSNNSQRNHKLSDDSYKSKNSVRNQYELESNNNNYQGNVVKNIYENSNNFGSSSNNNTSNSYNPNYDTNPTAVYNNNYNNNSNYNNTNDSSNTNNNQNIKSPSNTYTNQATTSWQQQPQEAYNIKNNSSVDNINNSLSNNNNPNYSTSVNTKIAKKEKMRKMMKQMGEDNNNADIQKQQAVFFNDQIKDSPILNDPNSNNTYDDSSINNNGSSQPKKKSKKNRFANTNIDNPPEYVNNMSNNHSQQSNNYENNNTNGGNTNVNDNIEAYDIEPSESVSNAGMTKKKNRKSNLMIMEKDNHINGYTLDEIPDIQNQPHVGPETTAVKKKRKEKKGKYRAQQNLETKQQNDDIEIIYEQNNVNTASNYQHKTYAQTHDLDISQMKGIPQQMFKKKKNKRKNLVVTQQDNQDVYDLEDI